MLLTRIALTTFVLVASFGSGRVAKAQPEAKPPAQVDTSKVAITRTNFISFWWCWEKVKYVEKADRGPYKAFFTVTKNTLHCQLGSGDDQRELTAPLSDEQLDRLIDKLNKRQQIVQEEAREEMPTFLFTLKFSDQEGQDKDDNGAFFDDTPQDNKDLESHLRNLEEMKFLELHLVTDDTP